MNKGCFVFLTFLLFACAGASGLETRRYQDPSATPSDFIYCYGYGCSQKLRLGLHEIEWQQVKNIFKKKSKDAEEERQKIGKAIALVEKMTGDLAGTKDDVAKAPIIRESNYELDCIDETVNTDQYLKFFEANDLLKFHAGGKPAFKGFFINGVYPHNTATIVEKDTGQVYVVDSYIFANGKEPVIRTYEDWRQTTTFESNEL